MKLLICYDINEKEENKRKGVEDFLMDITKHSKWVRLNGSVWVVLSNTSATSKFKAISDYIPKSLVGVIDISGKKVEYNDILQESEPDGKSILKSNY